MPGRKRTARKNPAAVALGKLGGAASAARRTAAKQAKIASLPRKPDAERCPCGATTAKRALTRWPKREGCCNNPGCLPATVAADLTMSPVPAELGTESAKLADGTC